MHEILEVLLESDEIQERTPFPERDEKVEVAVFASFTSGQGTKDPYVSRAVADCQVENLAAISLQKCAGHGFLSLAASSWARNTKGRMRGPAES